MNDQIILSRSDMEQIIEHHLGKLHPLDLISIINQFCDSWVQILGDTGEFVWTGGEKPSYLTSIVENDSIQNRGIDNH